jgi:N-acetylglucosamine kinase-like BadF-type ATPase
MGVTVVGVDGGNSKTEVVVATLEGEPLTYVRGPGSNSHGLGANGCAAVVGGLLRDLLDEAVDHGAFFLCGADTAGDVAELTEAIARLGVARHVAVDNDAFALLRTGTDSADAVAVVCGAGINCVGRRAGGRRARHVALGWETGDWGGSEMLGREVLFHAARGEDGRGEPTVLVELLVGHFGLPSVAALGEAVHYKRIPQQRLGELAPSVVTAAERDIVARRLVDRLAAEVALLAERALRDLELAEADVVLGGGMLDGGGPLVERVTAHLTRLAPGARVVVASDPPVLGATLAALDDAGAPPDARERLRAAFRDGLEPRG